MFLGSEFRAEAERSIGLIDTRVPGSVSERLRRNGEYLSKRVMGMTAALWLVGYLALAFSGLHWAAIGLTVLLVISWFVLKIKQARLVESSRKSAVSTRNRKVES